MAEKEFNLLREPWILVMLPDGEIREVSMLELFPHAHEYRRLAGELPTQDVALLRLLLAVLHAVFSRYDLDGRHAPFDDPQDALARWKLLWDRGAFPEQIIADYLLHFENRFWLFHPEYPFYQVAGMDEGTKYSAAKLNGELSESSNKVRLFPQRTGSGKDTLEYAEAARWLLYVNAFDDTSAKPVSKDSEGKGLTGGGAGWLGKLGLVIAEGENLFETLMLNLVLLKDGGTALWENEQPVWERPVRGAERTPIVLPDNPSALLTLQSRRLLLKREEAAVVGFTLLGGDYFPKENAFTEQMTVWRNTAKKEADPNEYVPRRHDPSRQLWRDFSALIVQLAHGHRPGIVDWIARLKIEGLVGRTHFRFQTAAVKYGDKDFFIDDVYADSLSVHADLLTELGEDWVNRITNEVAVAEKLVDQVGYLAQSIAKATGDSDGVEQRGAAKEQAYFGLDIPFRNWLREIDPQRDEIEKACALWWEQEQRIIRRLGAKIVREAGVQALVGRTVKEKVKGKVVERRYAAPDAYNYFLYRTSSKQALGGGKNG